MANNLLTVGRYQFSRSAAMALTAMVWTLWLTAGASAEGEVTEKRLAASAASPPWLQSVGRLAVPGIRYDNGRRVHHRENCSATLISPAGKRASIVVTAWHCLESYRDLSQTITFTLEAYENGDTVMEVRPIVDGGGMHADWAILKLVERNPRPRQPLGLIPAKTNPGYGDPLVMAGYSRDTGLGDNGKALTYHTGCRALDTNEYSTHSDCQAYKGASGGAVIQYSESGVPHFAGVISEGNSEGISTFVPVARFRSALNLYLH